MIFNYFKIKLYSSTYFFLFTGNSNIYIRKSFKNSIINFIFYRFIIDYRLKSKFFFIVYSILNRINFIDFIIFKFVLGFDKSKFDL